jgi:hypothetical protein
MDRRIGSRTLLPGAVKARNISETIFGSEKAVTTTSIGNGNQAVYSISLTQNKGFELLGIPYITLYVGSIADTNTLPGGASIDESQWQIIGPFFDEEEWEDNEFADHKEFARLYVRNISAGTVDLISVIKWRYFSPQEGAV